MIKFILIGFRGFDGAKIEMNIVSIAHNLKKIWKYRGERKEIKEKCVRLVIVCVEIKVIMGQPPLLCVFSVRKNSEAKRRHSKVVIVIYLYL